MRRDNRGFTLIELLIAISVLSIMGGVLLHFFVLSRRFNAKARTDEVVLDAAERTMEAIKGCSLKELDQLIQQNKKKENPKTQGTCILGDTTYSYQAADELYTLTKEEDLSLAGRTGKYVVEAQIAWSPYGIPGATESDAQTAPNTYQIPRIADVSTSQNIVLDYQSLLQKEEQWSIYFQSTYAKEDDDTEETSQTSDGGTSYDYSDTERYLCLNLTQEGTNLCVEPVVYYILDGAGVSPGEMKNKLNGNFEGTGYSLGKKKREISTNPDLQPRIYLFLPDRDTSTTTIRKKKNDAGDVQMENVVLTSHFKINGILINDSVKKYCELYVIPEQDSVPVTGDIVSENDKSNGLAVTAAEKNTGVNVYTFEDSSLVIPAEEADKRLYEITVSLYETQKTTDADGVVSWTKPESAAPLIQLKSTKRE